MSALDDAAGRSVDPRKPRRPRRRRGRRLLLWTGVAVVVALSPALWVQAVGQSHLAAGVSAVEHTDVALVLGAGLRPDGTPSTYLRRRLDAAYRLWAAGTVDVVLVSGDNRSVNHDEPTAMRDWLVGLGMPAEYVVRDFAGLDTHDTCVRARKIFGVTEAVVITQDYHVRRAVFSCRQAGIDTVGLGVSSDSVEPAKALVYRLRELPASLKAAWDAVTGREPAHLGPHETGVEDALARND